MFGGAIKNRLFPLADAMKVGGDLGAARDRMIAAGVDIYEVWPEVRVAEEMGEEPPVRLTRDDGLIDDIESRERLAAYRRAALHPSPPTIGPDMSRPVGGNEFHVHSTFHD
jgi:hypothetical protein